jgi:uncharacterized protein (DUF433 family)
MMRFERITMDPDMMGGKPCIRGMRVTVGMIVESLAAGMSIEDLLSHFPYLEEADIREALGYAARELPASMRNRSRQLARKLRFSAVGRGTAVLWVS